MLHCDTQHAEFTTKVQEMQALFSDILVQSTLGIFALQSSGFRVMHQSIFLLPINDRLLVWCAFRQQLRRAFRLQ
jgi:hypothetical protein